MTRIDVRIADFDADNAAIRRIRFAVFVDEQKVPQSLEMDDRDAHCVHVLAYAGDEAVGTGRIDLAKAGKIGRLAVMSAARRRGTGTALMHVLHTVAEDYGLRAVWCNAQSSVVPFYERLGYCVTSEPFFEAGIEHVRMDKTFASS